jgi:hypothetical protein
VSRAIVIGMHATLDTRTADELATRPGFVEAYALRRLGDGRHLTLALWTAADDPTAYTIEEDVAAFDAGSPAGAVATAYFDPPISRARQAAARFGFRERIQPALAAVPGLVRMLVLGRDGANCVVTITVDLPSLETTAAAISGTQLLPSEDPALLTGPDRVDVHTVTHHTTSAGARR